MTEWCSLFVALHCGSITAFYLCLLKGPPYSNTLCTRRIVRGHVLQGEYEAAKAESETVDAELKSLKSRRPAQLAAFLKARDGQASFIDSR